MYLNEILHNYENQYGSLDKDCFIVGEFETERDKCGHINNHFIKDPIKFELNSDIKFDWDDMISKNNLLRFADPRQTHINDLYQVITDILNFYFLGDHAEIEYIGIKEYIISKYPNLKDSSENEIIEVMKNEICNSILCADLQEMRAQRYALKKYSAYIMDPKYKIVGLKKDQRIFLNPDDELEIELYDGITISIYSKWIVESIETCINAKCDWENIIDTKQFCLTGTWYHPFIWHD